MCGLGRNGESCICSWSPKSQMTNVLGSNKQFRALQDSESKKKLDFSWQDQDMATCDMLAPLLKAATGPLCAPADSEHQMPQVRLCREKEKVGSTEGDRVGFSGSFILQIQAPFSDLIHLRANMWMF